MDTIRNAMGYGSQSGQEPLSGQTGQGTANDPYDAGNVAGQSGAPPFETTSTNPTGTTQYDTGTYTQTNTTSYGAGNDTAGASQHAADDSSGKTNTLETLAAGVTSGNSSGAADAPADSQPLSSTSVGNTSGAADKGTDESRGADEQVTSDQSRSISDTNANAQDTFFANAGISKDKPANPPKVASEVADKDPFSSGAASSNTANETNNQPAAPSSSKTASETTGGGLDNVGSTAPDKNYKTADTESHPQSSEVLSSATPGAALDSQPKSQTTSGAYDNNTTGTGNDNTTSNTTGSGGYDPTSSTTTAAVADTDYPSPKTQPTESQGGLAGVSHNTGSAPSAPDTGVPEATENPGLGASQGEGKKKIGDRIKEKLHIGKKSGE
ncbi:MAG: hypothetical protein Q9166_004140 [cf. Caloplaca sp. 2 TL-2023]